MNTELANDTLVELDLKSAMETTGGEDTVVSCVLNNWDTFKASFVKAFSQYDI